MDELITTKEDALIGASEASDILGIAQSTLRSWTSRGKGPKPAKQGWANKYSKLEIEEYALHYRKGYV